jgi:hypothetical protein
MALKETMNSIKHVKKNKNYNEILKKPFIFNLHTVSTTRRYCRFSLSRPDVIGCERQVAEWVITKTKKYVANKKCVFRHSELVICSFGEIKHNIQSQGRIHP